MRPHLDLYRRLTRASAREVRKLLQTADAHTLTMLYRLGQDHIPDDVWAAVTAFVTECAPRTDPPEANSECAPRTDAPEANSECAPRTDAPEANSECAPRTFLESDGTECAPRTHERSDL